VGHWVSLLYLYLYLLWFWFHLLACVNHCDMYEKIRCTVSQRLHQLLTPCCKWQLYALRLSVSRLNCLLLGHWPSSAVVLAAKSGCSTAGPVRPVADILMAVRAYRISHSACTDLLCSVSCVRNTPLNTMHLTNLMCLSHPFVTFDRIGWTSLVCC